MIYYNIVVIGLCYHMCVYIYIYVYIAWLQKLRTSGLKQRRRDEQQTQAEDANRCWKLFLPEMSKRPNPRRRRRTTSAPRTGGSVMMVIVIIVMVIVIVIVIRGNSSGNSNSNSNRDSNGNGNGRGAPGARWCRQRPRRALAYVLYVIVCCVTL